MIGKTKASRPESEKLEQKETVAESKDASEHSNLMSPKKDVLSKDSPLKSPKAGESGKKAAKSLVSPKNSVSARKTLGTIMSPEGRRSTRKIKKPDMLGY